MAKRKAVIINDEIQQVNPNATLNDVVEKDVSSVTTNDGRTVTRQHFSKTPVPEGFRTSFTSVEKGFC